LSDTNESLDVMSMVSEIAAAYVSKHEMKSEDLPDFIRLINIACSLSVLVSPSDFMLEQSPLFLLKSLSNQITLCVLRMESA